MLQDLVSVLQSNNVYLSDYAYWYTGVADTNKSNSNVLPVDYKVSAKRACDEAFFYSLNSKEKLPLCMNGSHKPIYTAR
ncbi:hypothetical protein Ahy_B04g073002 isoform C [Arachis hypogaea]|uniref:Uncharacterized protein n=1 Tax=Arachis hypogaea TaxID=3818 RepID=A0A444ZPF7_ARAHY|nr:hypothetical protein Ahy_B04g073002 isoform C [Arachis hypogaea]